jgi:hypothetical protein
MPDAAYFSQFANSPVFIVGAALAVLGAILVVAGLEALLRLRPLRFIARTLLGLLLISIGILAGTVAVGLRGYRALTHEDLALRVLVQPAGPQRFIASLLFPDGRQASYTLAGDEIYLDARVLKWPTYLNMVGLHTSYELDRVGGRYREIDQERSSVRTLYKLGREKPVDLFDLRRRYDFLAPFIDAQYGSAAFAPVNELAELELRVSTTGLLIRPSVARKDR